MYIPRDFVEDNPEFIRKFIQTHGFGTLVSHDGRRPMASQLLFHLGYGADGAMQLASHMARANPQWRTLERPTDVLVLFQGPHTYVSAAWYSVPSAPTWNYITVQAYGRATLVQDRAELYQLLKALVDSNEQKSAEDQGFRIESIPTDVLTNMMDGIVGFRIAVSQTRCAAKLSQNRNDADYGNIVEKLRDRSDPQSQAIAVEMERRRQPRKNRGGRSE